MTLSYQLGKDVDSQTRKGLGEHSPSRKLFEAGVYAILGLINGMASLHGDLMSEVDDTTDMMINPIREAINTAADLINNGVDAEPTIRPVLDLTEIQTGINTMNGLMPNNFYMTSSYA